MEYIGKGIGTLGIAAMVVGVAHFAPAYVGGVALAAYFMGILIWAN